MSCAGSENFKSAFSASLRFEVVLDIFVTEKSKAKDDILLQFYMLCLVFLNLKAKTRSKTLEYRTD